MHPNFHPPDTATSPTPASYLDISGQPDVDESNRFFDFDAWGVSTIDSKLSFAPCDTTFDFERHVLPSHELQIAPVHDARVPGLEFGSKIHHFLDSQRFDFLSADIAFSDLGLGQDWQCPTAFEASITLDDLNTFDKAMMTYHALAVDNIDVLGNSITYGNRMGSNDSTAAVEVNFAEHKPVASEHSHAGALQTCQRDPRPPIAPKSKRARISKTARKVLDDFFRSNPYPGEVETSSLVKSTQLTGRTIKTWFSNTRARKKINKASSPLQVSRDNMETSTRNLGAAQKICRSSLEALDKISPTASLNSLQRYLETPASEDAIMSHEVLDAVAEITKFAFGADEPISLKTYSIRTPSIADSDGSRSSARSWTSQNSFRSTDSRGSRRGRKQWMRGQHQVPRDTSRVTLRPVAGSAEQSPTPYFCTWSECDSTFKFRWEWARHEEALHYQPYHWICCLEGSEIDPLLECPFCDRYNITVDHIIQQHLNTCIDKSQEERRFLREDQFLQHMNGVHLKSHNPKTIRRVTKKDVQKLMSRWKIPNTALSGSDFICGFCGYVSSNWKERQDHVSQHVRQGMSKSSWSPERPMEPSCFERI